MIIDSCPIKALCDATVEQIVIENGRAVGVLVRNTSTGKDGPLTEIRAKNVVCATSGKPNVTSNQHQSQHITMQS